MKKLSFFLSALIAFGGSAFAQDNYADTEYVKVVTDDGVEAAVSAIGENGIFDVFVMHDWSIANRLNKAGITVNNYQAAENNPLEWGVGGNISTDAWPTGIFSLQEHGQWQLGDNSEYNHHVKSFRISGAEKNWQYWAGAYLNNTVARDFSHVNPDTHIHAIVYTDTDHKLYNWNVNFKFLRYDIPGGDDPNCVKMRLRQDYWDPNGLPWIGSMKGLSWVAIDITIGQIEKLMVEGGLQFDYTRLNNNANFQHILAIETPSGQDDNYSDCNEAQFAIDGVYMYTATHTEADAQIEAVIDTESGANDYYATYSNNYSDVEIQAAAGATLKVYNVNVVDGVLSLTQRANNKVARGEAVLVKTNATTFTASPLNACTLTPAAENQLVATPALAATVKCGEDYKLYRLTYDNVSQQKGLGFYFGNTDGNQIAAQPNKAYLKVPATQTASLKGFRINPQPTHVEGIEIEDASQLNEPVYDLSGRRVENPTTGFYLQGNKKIIVK